VCVGGAMTIKISNLCTINLSGGWCTITLMCYLVRGLFKDSLSTTNALKRPKGHPSLIYIYIFCYKLRKFKNNKDTHHLATQGLGALKAVQKFRSCIQFQTASTLPYTFITLSLGNTSIAHVT